MKISHKGVSISGSVLFLLSLFLQSGLTMGAATEAPPSRSQVLIDEWNDIGRKLIVMAEDFPEDKYEFKPTPAQRSFGQQLLHAANANYFFIHSATGQRSPAGDNAEFKTKKAIVAFVKKSFGEGAAVLKGKGDAGMDDLLTDPFSKKRVRLSDMAWALLEHSGEHYGQLVVYYRAAGLVPPESRKE